MQQALESFVLYLATERGLSANYQLLVRQVIESFFKKLEKNSPRILLEHVSQQDLQKHLGEQRKSGLAENSVGVHMVILRHFFRFLHQRGEIKKDPAADLTTAKIQQRLPDTLNQSDITLLLQNIDTKKPLGARDKAILELLYASGLRVSELTQLRLETYFPEEGMLRVTGKGNKTRVVPIGSMARESIAFYLKKERPRLLSSKSSSHIFLSIRGTSLTSQRIWQIVQKRARDAGLKQGVYPHLMRHSFATHLLEGGADLRVIQELLGHADISTTQIYTHLDGAHLKGVHEKFHPRGKKTPSPEQET